MSAPFNASPPPTHRRVQDVVDTLEQVAQHRGRGEWVVPEEYCRQWTQWSEPIERCWAQQHADGRALILTVAYDCVYVCSFQKWLVRGEEGFEFLPFAISQGSIAVTPELDALFVGQLGYHLQEMSCCRLFRIALRDFSEREWGKCLSPTVSPGQHWVVCRDARANVLRIPIEGGPAEYVYASGLELGEAHFVPDQAIYPDPVFFPDPETVVFTVVYDSRHPERDGQQTLKQLPWRE